MNFLKFKWRVFLAFCGMYTTLFNNSLSSECHWELNSRAAQELKKLRYERVMMRCHRFLPFHGKHLSINLLRQPKKERMEKTELIAVALGVSPEHWTLRLHYFQSRDRSQSPVWEISTPITYSAVPIFTNHLISFFLHHWFTDVSWHHFGTRYQHTHSNIRLIDSGNALSQ